MNSYEPDSDDDFDQDPMAEGSNPIIYLDFEALDALGADAAGLSWRELQQRLGNRQGPIPPYQRNCDGLDDDEWPAQALKDY